MKILFVPDWRKGNPYQELLAASLRHAGDRVSFDNYSKKWPILFNTAVAHPEVDILHLHWVDNFFAYVFWSNSRAKKIIKLFLLWIDIKITRISGKKIVWTIHNKFMHESPDILLEKRMRNLLLRSVDMVIIHSENAYRLASLAYGIKSFKNYAIVPHANFINEYPNIISREIARQKLLINSTEKVFLFFGNIRPYKGVPRLINEFKTNETLRKAKLLIVGKPLTKELSENIRNLVFSQSNILLFLDFIPKSEIQLYMNASDVVILPFEDILTSGSSILAMSFGKAVIVPETCRQKNFLDDQGAIFFGENKSLIHALEHALLADLDGMGKANLEAIRDFTWNKSGELLHKAYQKMYST